MNIAHLPSLRTEDFPDQQSWIGKLFIQLNPFVLAVQQIFNKNIDYETNIKSVTKEFTITEFQPFSIAWPFIEISPQSLTVIKATKGTALTSTILLAAWSFSASTREVTITSLVEVLDGSVAVASGNYTFTVRVTI